VYLAYIHVHNAAALLVLLRLWRVVEIVNGESVKERLYGRCQMFNFGFYFVSLRLCGDS